MKKIIQVFGVLLAILIASSILSGADVAFVKTWYSAPEMFSKFILTVLTMVLFVKATIKIINRFI